MESATILGCGVAGSWLAHHLAMLRCNEFVLFGGDPLARYIVELGPYLVTDEVSYDDSAAQALAKHLRRIRKDVQITVNANFDVAKDLKRVKGLVVGAMSDRPSCGNGGRAVIEAGHKFVTLGLPTNPSAKITFGSDPGVLVEGHFGGPPKADRYDIMLAALEALKPFSSGR